MKKVAIIGSGGAGKSTLARQLSEKIGIPVYHLDAILWKPNWVMTSKTEQRMIQNELITRESWIIDGNYGSTLDIRLNAADTIIYLDLPRTVCLYRAIKRRFQYRNRTRPDMAADCKEKLDMEFLKWIWNYPKVKRPAILAMLKELSNEKNVIILSSRKEIKRFIENGDS
ncbi:DNA topology modulation protein [Oceanobacillus luteolus]|uniref:DNA topology modulation protein n=1 Tax=Oceanobacillus luteolus TaxID=1274358 RepID=A0ABW4HWG6_9BACI|nr:DNA topology modulation protein [Oceanobacillus luteolus]MCM3741305.1 DNA topology modulation protein [Oceanobacillus luteolus]